MPHIHTQPGQHDHTVSAYIIHLGGEPKMLLHRHRKLGFYMQFGGHIELNEHPWQTISHEIKEESGYDLSQLQVIQPALRMSNLSNATLHPLPFSYSTHPVGNLAGHFHTDTAYAFTTSQEPAFALDPSESADIMRLTKSEIGQLSDKEILPNVREICLFILDHVLPEHQSVPATSFKL